jgi:hypothetical protein
MASVCEDLDFCQLSLDSPLQQNGLHRLIDIIRWPQVSARAGNNRDVLSFQRGILPILRVSLLLVLEAIFTSLLTVLIIRLCCQEYARNPSEVRSFEW